MKLELIWPSGLEKMFENIDGWTENRQMDDGRQSHWVIGLPLVCP